MAIVVSCHSCSSVLRVADSNAGKRGKCPKCGAVIRIPRPEEEEPAPGPSLGLDHLPGLEVGETVAQRRRPRPQQAHASGTAAPSQAAAQDRRRQWRGPKHLRVIGIASSVGVSVLLILLGIAEGSRRGFQFYLGRGTDMVGFGLVYGKITAGAFLLLRSCLPRLTVLRALLALWGGIGLISPTYLILSYGPPQTGNQWASLAGMIVAGPIWLIPAFMTGPTWWQRRRAAKTP